MIPGAQVPWCLGEYQLHRWIPGYQIASTQYASKKPCMTISLDLVDTRYASWAVSSFNPVTLISSTILALKSFKPALLTMAQALI